MRPDSEPEERPYDHEEKTEVLLVRAQDGDKQALSQILERYQSRLLRRVRVRLGPGLRGHLDSGDVLQEAMIEVIRSYRRFKPRNEGSFFRWLSSIVENKIRNAARSARRLPPREGGQSQILDRISRGETTLLEVERDEERDLIARGLEHLPDSYRQVLELRQYAQLSFAEIAEQMGCTTDAANSLHTRARARLTMVVERLGSSQDLHP